ncbi:unnamed protein product [Allacma fusca]|uniref:Uncharacterized protein n=1 Tax=Allacma fusca TaxID=39272 RepID=A0A8J2JN82_9HEXA|nr:unnamed protein product [Allacma fusca]
MMAHDKRSIPELRVVNESNEDVESNASTSTLSSPLFMKAPLLAVPSAAPRRRHSWVYGGNPIFTMHCSTAPWTSKTDYGGTLEEKYDGNSERNVNRG